MTNVKDGEWKPENYTHCQRTIIQRKNKDTDCGGWGVGRTEIIFEIQ